MHGHVAHVRKHGNRVQVAGLLFQDGVVDGAPVNARRRTGLEAALGKLQFLQALTQRNSRRVAGASARIVLQANVDQAVQEGARGQHYSLGPELQANLRHGANDTVALHHQVLNGLLEQPQVRLVLEAAADGLAIQHPIRLRARRTDSWPLRAVQDSELDAGLIRGQCHGPTEGVHLFDEVALADSADGRIARHLTKGLDVVREQQRLRTSTGCSQSRFGAGVAATDDDDIEFAGIVHDGGR